MLSALSNKSSPVRASSSSSSLPSSSAVPSARRRTTEEEEDEEDEEDEERGTKKKRGDRASMLKKKMKKNKPSSSSSASSSFSLVRRLVQRTPLAPAGSTMREVHAYVDKHMNCEDIAMSFLVANLTEKAAVWVRGAGIREIGSSGLSSNQKVHYAHRSDCVDHFTRLFGRMPLLVANQKVDRAVNFWLWR